MKSRTIDLFYFSGTGNTLLAIRKMQSVFSAAGYTVAAYPIETARPDSIDPSHILGLAFPVVGLSTFPFVWRFLEALPEVQGTEVFMLDTLAGVSGGVVGPLKHLLIKKGYTPIGACEVKMPPNIFFIMGNDFNKERVESGLRTAHEYAQRLIAGTARWSCIPLLSDTIGGIARIALNLFRWKPHQHIMRFTVTKERCTRCGVCAQLCPVHNITLKDLPLYGLDCEYCMRCVSFCPTHAITCLFNYKNATWHAVDAKDLLP
jgi:NAD-dependent dihydropyrimidine dehydrogenase PreA subunit